MDRSLNPYDATLLPFFQFFTVMPAQFTSIFFYKKENLLADMLTIILPLILLKDLFFIRHIVHVLNCCQFAKFYSGFELKSAWFGYVHPSYKP